MRAGKLSSVAVNFAITWDGKVSTRNFTPADFTSSRDKRRLLEIRATGDALLVAHGTLAKDNMGMGLPDESLRRQRTRRGQAPYPLRVIISNSGRINPKLKVFQSDFSPIVIYSTTQMPPKTRTALAGKAALHLHAGGTVDLQEMLLHLRKVYEVKRLVCEGGPSLFRSLLAAGFVDEINLTLSPRIFGGAGAPTLTGPPGDFLPHSVSCKLMETKIVGDECFLRYRVPRQK
ncbi:MAG TPA: dihydrofolate reductase family protein [Chthoniobacteraceae bacterium]|nr:dihydrofolate reductase family protein [Chthoniobacteraceae bacterium]